MLQIFWIVNDIQLPNFINTAGVIKITLFETKMVKKSYIYSQNMDAVNTKGIFKIISRKNELTTTLQKTKHYQQDKY